MFAISVPPGTRLPFTTAVIHRISFEHQHRDYSGFAWKEPMTLDIHLLAIDLRSIPPVANDNERKAHG
jgi:hypothetical protein